MVCKLCLKSSDLKKSHIIPEAFFKRVYGNKHRTFLISMEDEKLKFIQKGITEQLLCGNCEQKFSKWETILKKSLIAIGEKKSNSLKFTFHDEYQDIFKVENIKYKELWYFLLGKLNGGNPRNASSRFSNSLILAQSQSGINNYSGFTSFPEDSTLTLAFVMGF